MFFNSNTVRLNKALRELEISLDTAIDYLNSLGLSIEARPTTKISNDIYTILVSKFKKADNRLDWLLDLKETCEAKGQTLSNAKQRELDELQGKKVDDDIDDEIKQWNTENEWLIEAENLGIQLVHPSYQDFEEFVMRFQGAKGLRDAERNNEAESYLIIREAIRRHMKGHTNQRNNYIKLAVRAYQRRQKSIVDDKLNVTGTYSSKHSTGVKGTQVPAGTEDEFGRKWVPYFRIYVPFEEYDLLNRIGGFKGTWNNTTLREGKKAGDVAKYRQEAFVNGYADKLLEQFNLPLSYKVKLTLTYNSRKKH